MGRICAILCSKRWLASVYATGKWDDIQSHIYTFKRDHVIVGEIPPKFVDEEQISLFINAPLGQYARGKIDARVRWENRKISLWDPNEKSSLVPDLQINITDNGIVESRDGFYVEGYFLDPNKVISFQSLPKVEIYETSEDGLRLVEQYPQRSHRETVM